MVLSALYTAVHIRAPYDEINDRGVCMNKHKNISLDDATHWHPRRWRDEQRNHR